MLIKYCGTRPFVSVVLSGRVSYYFGEENNYLIEVENQRHVNELLRSVQHRFEVLLEKPEPKKVEKPEIVKVMPRKEKIEVKKVVKPKKRRKKNA